MPIEDTDIFFNPEEFGVEAIIREKSVAGLMSSVQIISNDVETLKTTFTCTSRFVRGIGHGEKVRIKDQYYQLVGLQPEGSGLTVLILEAV
jgi:hypothetical protein